MKLDGSPAITLKLKMERMQSNMPAEANDSQHASLANFDRLAGRGICVESQIWLPRRQAPVPASVRLLSGIMHYSRRGSFVGEPSFRTFFRARFRAKACFTRRFSPGFK
jgi:hypothetical protein